MANLDVAREAPTAANVTVKAPRDYLTEREVERLMDAARENRWGHRDATAILVAFRHGLRASELVGLRWDDIDWQTSTLHVRRAKGAYRHPAAIGREGTASAAPVAAGSLGRPHLCFRAGCATERCGLSADGWPCRRGCSFPVPDPQPHAAAFLRLQARQ